jgi:Translation initiation factor IF-3, N-terminal domain
MIKDDLPLAGSGAQADPEQQVRLIDLLGKQLGVMTLSQAEAIAMGRQLKLRCIASSAKPPVYRLFRGRGKGPTLEKRWNM